MARAVEMWSLALAGSLLAGAGCSREEASTTSAATSAAASAPPVAPAATDLVGYVATYPTMEPQPGRRRLQQQFAVYPSADAKSKELARLDSGAIVDLKASYQDWMLVAFQSGGQPTLGWIELKVDDTRATTVTDAEARAATATPAPKTAAAGATGSGTTPDAGTTAGGDAGATGSGDAGAADGGTRRTSSDAGTTAGGDAGTTAGGDAGATGSGDAGAADGGTRRKIILKRP
ncbi:hypothetical protein [Sorangium cellulosum]|uniref:hypothetical protein n=1 Tax=Sorangium cellulosum TaxID=56 RepID=UPI00042381B8|nr:hypothetical protein [Sorangium cellulosum]